MHKRALFLILLSILAGLNVASIRRSEDPVRDTQTNPILYSQKMEEEKDGKKGPLLYHVKNNPREAFFIDPPYEAEAKAPVKETGSETASPSSADTGGWWEEQPAGTTTAATPEESIAPPVPQSLPEGTVPAPSSELSTEEEPAKEFSDTEKEAEAPVPAAAADSAGSSAAADAAGASSGKEEG